ncbi:MAG: hypothetical protein ACOCRU_03090 [bacterium]
MRKLMILLIVLLVSLPIFAISGSVELNYNTLDGTGQGIITLDKSFDNLELTGIMLTKLNRYNLKGGYILAGVPHSQTFELIADYELYEGFSVVGRTGCEHIFQQSEGTDGVWLTGGIKYTW